MIHHFEIVIVGGGIVGLSLARTLLQRGHSEIAIFDKESRLGRHASGKNSGVLHAGVYYPPESLKAKVCRRGSQLMQEFAAENRIACNKNGKVIVASHQDLLPEMEKLFQRAQANGVQIEKLTPGQLEKIEPAARTVDTALYTPDTAVIDSSSVLLALQNELRARGVIIYLNREIEDIEVTGKCLRMDKDRVGYGFLINAAGLHADRVAHMMGHGKQYCMLPFKGIYKRIRPEVARAFRGSIYPVPNPNLPFLGVHITSNIYGDVMVGPTAFPAWGRENYYGLGGVSLADMGVSLFHMGRMISQNSGGFRQLLWQEGRKFLPHYFLKEIQALAPGIRNKDIMSHSKVGIRAQLFNKSQRKLEMDFVIERGSDSVHILNSISPGFTSAFAFAEVVCDKAGL